MVAVDYGVIREWVRYWEKDLLGEPKELVLGSEHLPNVLPEARKALEAWRGRKPDGDLQRSSKGPERKLADLVDRAVREDPVTDLVAREYPDEIGDLKRLLSAGSYDVSGICPILEKISGSPSSRILKEALLEELPRGEEAALPVVDAAAAVLAHRGVGRFKDGELRKLLGPALAELGILTLAEEHLEEMGADGELRERAQTVARKVVGEAAASGDVADALSGTGPLFDLFGGHAWPSRVYGLLWRLRELWTEELQERARAGEGEPEASRPVESLLGDEAALAELGVEVVRSYATAVLRRSFELADPAPTDDPEPDMLEAGRGTAAFLAARGALHNPYASGEDPLLPFVHKALRAASSAVQIETSSALADRYVEEDQEFVLGEAARLGRRMTEMLLEWACSHEAVGSPLRGTDEKAFKGLCLDWIGRPEVQAELGSSLLPLNGRLLDRLRGWAADSDGWALSLGEGYWGCFARCLSKNVTRWQYVPWHFVDEERLGRILDRLFERLEGREAEYLTVFRVGRLRPEGLRWRAGATTFYDPEAFDYGEDRRFRGETPERGSFTHAGVRVTARTKVEAARLARRRLEEALDCLSFGTSARRVRSGYKPEVRWEVFVLDLGNGGWRLRGDDWPKARHTQYQAGASDVPKLMGAYDHLLSLSAEGRELNDLQKGFLKAARWYREARWEEDPAERFALYWIALEHVFAGGQEKKGERVYADVPDLQITWRNVGRALFFLGRLNAEVWQKMEGDEEVETLADGAPELEGWRSDPDVLLSPTRVRALRDRVPAKRADVKMLLDSYLKELEDIAAQKEDIGEYVDYLRDRQWFKLYLLYDLRNRMFHEAVYDDERLPYLADEIGDVADGVLPKVAEEAVSKIPKCTTVAELVNRFGRQPWDETA